MKNHIISTFALILVLISTIPACGQKPNTLTTKEKKSGWFLLFNDKDFTGWRQCNGTEMPKNWSIEDNAMKVFTGEGKKPGQGQRRKGHSYPERCESG